jgi:hypothetical protein
MIEQIKEYHTKKQIAVNFALWVHLECIRAEPNYYKVK